MKRFPSSFPHSLPKFTFHIRVLLLVSFSCIEKSPSSRGGCIYGRHPLAYSPVGGEGKLVRTHCYKNFPTCSERVEVKS